MSAVEALASRLRGRREELLSELKDIDEALRRIEEGTYGLCSRCGQAIDAERLAGCPAASWCRACKHGYERRRGIYSPDHGSD